MSISGTLTGFCMEHYFKYYISTLCTLRKVKHSSHFHLSFIQKRLGTVLHYSQSEGYNFSNSLFSCVPKTSRQI